MSQNEQYYLVRLPLTDGEETNIRSELLEGSILDPAHMFARLVGIIGAPIQPCAYVENVTGPDDWCPLVRRTDMEAQVDAAILRRREVERAALYTVPFDVARAVAELPDRTSPDGDPEMMRVTTKELLGIVRSAIDAAMNAENGNG
ncbi:hypothetical protein [Gluconacetobacter entanii]|uniref:Uncharacterized protein n=1 Tax=Gluconacetobacter entanii TaxID=108528 RepID=A0A318PSJ3_9PROT|nr:hypothetical protein [Gluconacetobacter entanii]PYD63531.1 hypothetical protein CFR72_06385 [Gluconacetobacter entanii]